jgi:hypothetical protein
MIFHNAVHKYKISVLQYLQTMSDFKKNTYPWFNHLTITSGNFLINRVIIDCWKTLHRLLDLASVYMLDCSSLPSYSACTSYVEAGINIVEEITLTNDLHSLTP